MSAPAYARAPTYRRLRVWNIALAVLHAAQGVVILVLANDFSIPVTLTFLDGPPGSGLRSEPSTLFEVMFGWAIAAFLFLASLDHLLVAAPRIHRWYERNLAAGVNPARWYEYSLSASIMIVLIAMLTGIVDRVRWHLRGGGRVHDRRPLAVAVPAPAILDLWPPTAESSV
jgi:Heliorhodopsin